MTGPSRAPILTAVLVALVCLLPAAAPGRAGTASPFRQVVAYTDGWIERDGVRVATIANNTGPPLVFDTLRGRRLRPAPPLPECRYGDIGSGFAVWHCPEELLAYGSPVAVAHTCNRVFAQWSRSVYVARFEPRRGAPPCQAGR